MVLGETPKFYKYNLHDQGLSHTFSRIRDQNEIGDRPDYVGGLGAFIDFDKTFFFRDGKGRPLPAEKQRLFAHLKATYDQQNRFRGHETTYRCFCSLNRVAEMLRLPKSVHRRAAYLFRKTLTSQRRPRGATSLIIMGYCTLLATREFDKTMRTEIRDIAEAFQKLGHRVTAKAIVRVGVEYRNLLVVKQRPPRSEDYLGRSLDKVLSDKRILRGLKHLSINPCDYQQKIMSVCRTLLERVDCTERGGRNPYIFAASTIYAGEIYLARQLDRKKLLTQKIVAEIAGVAEYSIREHFCTVLKKHLKHLDDYEDITPSDSPVSDSLEEEGSRHLNPILISRRR